MPVERDVLADKLNKVLEKQRYEASRHAVRHITVSYAVFLVTAGTRCSKSSAMRPQGIPLTPSGILL